MTVPAQTTERLVALTRCPRCGATLAAAASRLVCHSCLAMFPFVGALPCLLSEPATALASWRTQLARFHAMMQQTRAGIEADLGRFDLLPSVRARLARTLAANSVNVAQITALLARAGIEPDEQPAEETDAAGGSVVPLVEHFEQLVRDWGWDEGGNEENAIALRRLLRSVGEATELGPTVVLGAGACRLAYDLAAALPSTELVALDIDPLMLLVGHEVMFGNGLELVEVPIDPAHASVATVARPLSRPGASPPNLALLLADAFDPPFAAGTFATVITPWFIDVSSEDFREVLAVVHHLLAVGGRWINQGPLLHATKSFARRHTQEEIIELLQLSGFEVLTSGNESTTYLQSPASPHARLEGVFSFVARKGATWPASVAGTDTPVWIILPHLPVPVFPGLATFRASHPAFEHVQALVDGERSLSEIALELESRVQLPTHVSPVDVAGALLLKVYQEVARA